MGRYGEILINYNKIDEAIRRTEAYLVSLDRVESAIDQNSQLLEDQRGEVFITLEERRRVLKNTIAVRREQTTDLRTLLMNYKDAMNALIHPVSRGTDTRVNRNDIRAKLEQIKMDVRDVFAPKIYPPNQTNPYEHWVSDDNGGGHTERDQAKIDRESRNGSKVDGFQDHYLPEIKKAIEESIASIDLLNKNHIQAFENMDDEYAAIAQQLYEKYAGIAVQQRQDYIYGLTGQAADDIFSGFIDGAKEMFFGFGELFYTLGGIVATGIPSMFGFDPPVWAQMVTNQLSVEFADVRNPLDFFKKIGMGIAQSYVDKYNDKGLAYVIGNGLFDFVTIFLGATKLSKLSKLGDVAEDVAKGTEATEGLKEATNVTGKIKITSDFGEYATKIDKEVSVINQESLPQKIIDTFKNGQYRTVVTDTEIKVYRIFGGRADAGGRFVTTTPSISRIDTKIDSALLPEWGGSMKYEAEITIPKGTKLNIGKVAPQKIESTGTILEGGADQILLPNDWPLDWISVIRTVPSL